MHICFIVQNSLSMMQKTSNNDMTFFDQVKYALETVIKSLHQTNIISHEDIIHLFLTSSTQPISSFQDNDLHLLHQIKNIECTIPTFPSLVIQSALYHIGKFRCLNETQTLLGYRQGTISQPALIFYITDRSNQRQINKIYKSLIQKKLQLRAEYKFITIKFCSPSISQNNTMPFEKFKSSIEKQKQSIMMENIMKKMNGELLYAFKAEGLVNLIKKKIQKFKPFLTMEFQHKQYKIYNKQLIKIQLPIQNQLFYLQKLKRLGKIQERSQIFPCQQTFFLNTLPTKKRSQIPLPFDIQSKYLNTTQSSSNSIVIDEFQNLKFCVDFTKQYVGDIDNLTKYFFDIYQVQESQVLSVLDQQFSNFFQEKKFPLFYEKKKTQQQYLIGFLRLFYQPTTKKPLWQIHISFSNFVNLNSNIRAYKQKNGNAQQYFHNYISTLPLFYHKFLKSYLQHFNIQINYQQFDNINARPIGVTNLKFYQNRLNEKKLVQLNFKVNKEKHEKNQADCCSIYSSKFEEFEKNKSNFYSPFTSGQPLNQDLINKFYENSLNSLSQFKNLLGIYDYLTIQRHKSVPLKKQFEKYNIRRQDDQINEIVGDLLGNPFKKLNKKVKLDDEAESIWVDMAQVEQMKKMLEKEKDLVEKIQKKQTQSKQKERKQIQVNKTQSLFDQVMTLREKLKQDIKKSPERVHELEEQKSIQYEQQGQNQDSLGHSKILRQEQTSHFREQQNLEKSQGNIVQGNIPSQKHFKSQQNQQQIKNQVLTPKLPQIIQQVNSKFKMEKQSEFNVPVNLIACDRYMKNKAIFDEISGKNK